MDLHFEKEQMNAVFTKHHIKGLPFDAVVHHFSKKDENDHIHDHPFGFITHILYGYYIERVYYKAFRGTGKWEWSYKDFKRSEGDSHYVSAKTVHEIIEVSPMGCFSIITPEEKVQDVSFYKFINNELVKVTNNDIS